MDTWLGETLYGALHYILKTLVGSWGGDLWEIFAAGFASPLPVMDMPVVTTLMRISAALAMGILPIVAIFNVLRQMYLSLDGASSTPPETLVRRTITAGVAVSATALYAWFAATLADMARALLAGWGVDFSLLEIFFRPLGTVSMLLLALIFVVGAALVWVQRSILWMEFAGLLIIGPFLAISLAGEDAPMAWQLWKREIAAVVLTPVLQLLFLLIAVLVLTDTGEGLPTIQQHLYAFALLYLIWNTPRWARQFTYSSGAGDAAAGMVTGAGRLAVMRYMLNSAVRRGA